MNGDFHFFWSVTEWMERTQCWFVPLSANTMSRNLLVAKVLGLSWIPAGSVMMERLQPQTSGLRKLEEKAETLFTPGNLFYPLFLVLEKASHYCYTTLHAVMEI